MKYDPICSRCSNECKQPAAAKLVSCPQFKQAGRNLDLFDMSGNINKDLAQKNRPAVKSTETRRCRKSDR